MEAIQAGWLSVLPPVIAIVLAFLTKEVISSLTLGILSGAVIYAALSYDGVVMVAAKTVETAFPPWEQPAARCPSLIFCCSCRCWVRWWLW